MKKTQLTLAMIGFLIASPAMAYTIEDVRNLPDTKAAYAYMDTMPHRASAYKGRDKGMQGIMKQRARADQRYDFGSCYENRLGKIKSDIYERVYKKKINMMMPKDNPVCQTIEIKKPVNAALTKSRWNGGSPSIFGQEHWDAVDKAQLDYLNTFKEN